MTRPTAAPELLLVLTTLASADDARALARALLERRLVACAQISAVESLYRWDGAVQQEPEARLLLKTTTAQWPALQAAVRALHPYTLPALLALPVARALPAFADWVRDETASPPPA